MKRLTTIATLLLIGFMAYAVAAQSTEATVTFDDQERTDDTVVVAQTWLPEGGFITIHDDTLLAGNAMGSVRGTSDYLEAGNHTDVEITLNGTLEGTITLIAMPHMDTDGDETYGFVESNGTEDGPYTAQGGAVTDDANVTFRSDQGTGDGGMGDGGMGDGGMGDGGIGDGDTDADAGDDDDEDVPAVGIAGLILAAAMAVFISVRRRD